MYVLHKNLKACASPPQYFLSGWRIRTVFWLTTLMRVLASLVDIVIIKRWNTVVGVSDTAMYMLGYNIVYQVPIHVVSRGVQSNRLAGQ